jgi:hypothetical protein
MDAMNAPVSDPVQDFGGTALAKVYPNIDFTLVEKVAAALLERKVLDEGQLAAIIGSRRSQFASRYRLQRMIGHGSFRSAIRATRGFDY